jgi:putative addiction module killer protein
MRIRKDTIVVYELRQTRAFEKWFANLRDARVRARILARFDLARMGHFSDCHFIGEGVGELRLDIGPGYRLYFVRDSEIIILLCGGDKSTQARDITRAKVMARKKGAGTSWD